MNGVRFTAAVFAALLLSGVTLAGGEGAGAQTQDLVFLGQQGPVLIRLRIEVDGRPAQALFKKYCQKWVRYLDRDGDGLLNAEELKRLPTAQEMFQISQGGFFFLAQGTRRPTPGDFGKSEDDMVSAADLMAYYQKGGLTFARVIPGPVPLTAQNAVGEALFNALDANGDGKLSPEEFARGLELIHKLDLNDDEYLSPAELSPTTVDAFGRPLVLSQPNRPGQAGLPEALFAVQSRTNIVQLTDRKSVV